MACSNIRSYYPITEITHISNRYGPGVTQEVGLDMASLGAKNVGVYTDSTLVKYVSVTLFLMSAYRIRILDCNVYVLTLVPQPATSPAGP